MAKESNKLVENSSNSPATVDNDLIISIDEYCSRRSETDRRVSLIAGFCFVMEKADKLTGSVAYYDREFEEFSNQGV